MALLFTCFTTRQPKSIAAISSSLGARSVADNQLTDVPKGLEKLTQLMNLEDNPDLTAAQIGQLQKALPKCKISYNAKKQLPPSRENP